MSKYGNKRIEIDGIRFASQKEGYRYVELKYLQRLGVISDLRLQVKFELIPKMKSEKGKVIQPLTYIADFVYTENGKQIVEDVKGYKTKVYEIKKKLMRYVHGIEIKEVTDEQIAYHRKSYKRS